MAYLVKENRKSSTIKSYISAIKAVLADIKVPLNLDKCLLNSLTGACKLHNDQIRIRLPIQCDLLQLLLKTVEHHFLDKGQIYLSKLYMAIISTAYYGLFRIGELTSGPHVIKVKDVHIGVNKDKVLFVLWTSKTHNKNNFPQSIKIASVKNHQDTRNHGYCPFILLREYLQARHNYTSDDENFFVFRDRSVVSQGHFRGIFQFMLRLAGFDHTAYSSQGLQAGRACDLMKIGISVETIKKLGWWKSNAVYVYLK